LFSLSLFNRLSRIKSGFFVARLRRSVAKAMERQRQGFGGQARLPAGRPACRRAG